MDRDNTKQILINAPLMGQSDWWIEVVTKRPFCVYYFGPFESSQEANALAPGYLEDLSQEDAECISVLIQQCNPANLTICSDDACPS